MLEQHFGIAVPTIPLDETPDIQTGNALAMDWQALLPKGETFSYILGNPPFIGSKMIDAGQRVTTSYCNCVSSIMQPSKV